MHRDLLKQAYSAMRHDLTPHPAHHGRHGLGYRDRGAFALLRQRFRQGDRDHLSELRSYRSWRISRAARRSRPEATRPECRCASPTTTSNCCAITCRCCKHVCACCRRTHRSERQPLVYLSGDGTRPIHPGDLEPRHCARPVPQRCRQHAARIVAVLHRRHATNCSPGCLPWANPSASTVCRLR